VINTSKIIKDLQEDPTFLPEDLLIIIGPTASGKTKFAVELAKQLDAEIISADSRQVYRHMNIGTGKDLSEYANIPYHLIDILDPGDKYNIDRFLSDFQEAYNSIITRKKRVIVCGGTGFYIQSLLQQQPFIHIPINPTLRAELELKSKEELGTELKKINIPNTFKVDLASRKRIIRAIEICTYLLSNPDYEVNQAHSYRYRILGLNPQVETRRERISTRLQQRLEEGMIAEVKSLLSLGISHGELEYYGLEYKYISYYLKGLLSYEDFYKKLETEIHRYAKRQMTYFRKMERDGIKIEWINN
jgi:tRNA dimethylallyltransferase